MLSFCFFNHSLSLSLSVQYCVCFRLWRCLLVMSQMQDTYIHEGRASSSSPSSPKTRTDGRVWEQPTPEKHHHLVQHSNRNHIIGGWMLTSHCTHTHTQAVHSAAAEVQHRCWPCLLLYSWRRAACLCVSLLFTEKCEAARACGCCWSPLALTSHLRPDHIKRYTR